MIKITKKLLKEELIPLLNKFFIMEIKWIANEGRYYIKYFIDENDNEKEIYINEV